MNRGLLERAAPTSVARLINGLRPRRARRQLLRGRVRLAVAGEAERETIYRLRHEVYAGELAQHAENGAGQLSDALDAFNVYLTASVGGQVVGFISVTPPRPGRYSLDKYVARERLPFAFDAGLYEVRLLTVVPEFRGQHVAVLLMYAAFRWVEAHGGTRLMAIGRREVLELYLRAGLRPVGLSVQAGAVTFEVMQTPVRDMREGLEQFGELLGKLEGQVDWQLGIPFHKPAPCFHGGAFFETIGERFEALERRHDIINADVLDAWFPPSPRV